jgi:hypothetical protein
LGAARLRAFVAHPPCEGCRDVSRQSQFIGGEEVTVAKDSARRRDTAISSRGALPSQADDVRAHHQQNGDAYSDNDQEEFSHCSASLGPQRKAAGIVLG